MTSGDWKALMKFSNKHEQIVKESHNKTEVLNSLIWNPNKEIQIGIEEDNEEEKSDEEMINKKPKIERLTRVMDKTLMNHKKYGFLKDTSLSPQQPLGELNKISKILKKTAE
ncbi:unnamed protein product [Blepharisma stoltei]|uniref:Uncharacterized protein n=1 Tax=Blepharisma stoltei TaxID=1481888 RepID=A0AAU9IN73_9CILI|nr:unnamed protein product [Blepharisma stoltei]